MSIILKSPVFVITEVKKKTTAKFFDKLGVGSRIQLEARLSSGYYGNKTTTINLNDGSTDVRYTGNLCNVLQCFKLEEEQPRSVYMPNLRSIPAASDMIQTPLN